MLVPVTIAKTRFWPGDRVSVHGSSAIVHSGPDAKGYYEVIFVGDGFLSGPISANRLKSALGDSDLPVGEDVGWHGLQGVVLTSSFDGKYVILFDKNKTKKDQAPRLGFLPGMELRTTTPLERGDEVVVYGDVAVVEANAERDGLYHVVFVKGEGGGDASYPVPEFALHRREAGFDTGEKVFVDKNISGVVVFGPDKDWNYLVRFANSTISGPISEARLSIASKKIVSGASVEVGGEQGIVVAGPDRHGHFAINLRSGHRIHGVPAWKIQRLHAADASDSNPFLRIRSGDLRAAHEAAEDDDYNLRLAGERDPNLLRVEADAEEIARRVFRLTNSPGEAGRAARERVERSAADFGYGLEEVEEMACRAAARAVLLNSPKEQPISELVAIARAAALAAGLATRRGERAHLSSVAEAVAKAGGSPKTVGLATLSAAAVLGAEDSEEIKLAGSAAAHAAAEEEARGKNSPGSVGHAALKSAEAVGLRDAAASRIAARAAARAILGAARLSNSTNAATVTMVLRTAIAAAGPSQEEGREIASSAVQAWMAERRSRWEVGMKLLGALDASDRGSILQALRKASVQAADSASKAPTMTPESIAEAAAAAGRWEGVELDPVTIASIAARATAVASVDAGVPPGDVASTALASAASVEGISTDKAALIAALASSQAVLKAMVLIGSSTHSMAVAGKEACGVAGLPEHDQSRLAAWAGAHVMVLSLLGSGIDLPTLGLRSSKLAVDAGLSEEEASILAGEALAKSVFRSSIDDGDGPEEVAAAVSAAFASTNVSSALRPRLSTALLAELAAQGASRRGAPAAEIGVDALRFAQASESQSSSVFAEAAAAAAAAAAHRSTRSGATLAGIASAARQAAEGAKCGEEKARHVAAAAAAAAVAWQAAEAGESAEEIGSLALGATNSTGISGAEAEDLASDAAAPAAVSAAFARGTASKENLKNAAVSALKGAGVSSKYRLMRAARAVARDVVADSALEAWSPTRIAEAALFGVDAAGLLCQQCSAPVASVVATAVARSSLEKGLSPKEVKAAADEAMEHFWQSTLHNSAAESGRDTALEVTNLKRSDVEQAVRQAVKQGLKKQESPAKLGLHGEQAIEALLRKVLGESRHDQEVRPSAALASKLVSRAVAEAGKPPAAVTYAALAAAEAAGGAPGGSEETVRLAAAAAAEAVAEHLSKSESPESVGRAAVAAMRAAGLTPNAEHLAGLKSDGRASARAAEAAALAVMSRRWTDPSTEGTFPSALEAARNATVAAGVDVRSSQGIVGRVAARLAAKRGGGRPFDLEKARGAAQTAALAAGLSVTEAKAEAALAADLAGERGGQDSEEEIFMLSDAPDVATDDALLFAKPHSWGEALQVPSSSSLDQPVPWAAPSVDAPSTSTSPLVWILWVGFLLLIALSLPALVAAAILLEKMRTSSPSDVRTLNRFCCASHQTYTAHYSALDLSCQSSSTNHQIATSIALTKALDWYPHAKLRGRRLVVVLENANLDAATQLSRHTGSLGDQDRRNFAEFSVAYFATAALLESELHRSGHLLVYILSVRGEMIEINPHLPMPATPQRFARLIAEALSKGSAGGRGGSWALLTSCSTSNLLSQLPPQSRRFRCTMTNSDPIRPVVEASALREYVVTEEQIERQARRNRIRGDDEDKEMGTLPTEVPILVSVPCGLDPRLATKFDEEERANSKSKANDDSEEDRHPRQDSKTDPHLPIGMQPLYLDVQQATIGGGDPSAALCRKVCETFSDFWRPLPPPAYPWSPIATFAETWLFYEP